MKTIKRIPVATALVLAACGFDVTNPGPVPDEVLDDPGAYASIVRGVQFNLSRAVSINAYMRFGFDGAIATATLPTPTCCFGSPLASRVHVVPPSRERNTPLPGPPLSGPHGFNWSCHIPARRIREFFGFIATSEQPVFSSTKRTRFHVLPLSVVRNTPRSGCGPDAWPSAHANATLASAGSTTSRAMRPVFSSPICVHVLPASVDL